MSFAAIAIGGLVVGAAAVAGKAVSTANANKKMRELQKQTPVYTQSEEASKRLGLAQQLFNARMPGASAVERNIAVGMSGTMANASRAATSGAQLLAMGANAQGIAGEQYNQLAMQEAANKQQQYQNLVGAQEGSINESDKSFQDRTRRYEQQVQIESAIAQNRQNTWQSVGNLGSQAATLGFGNWKKTG